MEAIRTADEPWGRLPWLVTMALPITLLSMMGFLGLLERPLSVPPTLPQVDVQVIEVPTAVSAPVPREAPKAAPTPPAKRKVEPAMTRPVPSAAPTPSFREPERDTRPTQEAPVSAPTADSTGQPTDRPQPQAATPPTASLAPSRGMPGDSTGASPGGGRMSARAIYKPMPELPDEFRRRNIELVAVARFRVAANGTAQVDLIEPTSDPELNRVLLESLKRWKFFPALQDGKPVASNIDIRIPISVR